MFHGSAADDLEEETNSSRGHHLKQVIESRQPVAYQKISPPPRLIEPAPERIDDLPIITPDKEWGVLESLFHLDATVTALAGSADHSHLEGTTLFGACGGVGTTSILAALGRIGTKAGFRILLVDSSSPTLLPLYFGGQSPRSQISTFVSAGYSREQPIHFACSKTDNPVPTLASEIDRFYVDGGLLRSGEGQAAQNPSMASLLVLVPDARCLAELKRLQLQESDLPFLLLNQYDSRQPLHREIQNLLSQKFRERLIPITISLDPDVSVALAQGKTVIDYSPDSPATDDLYRLHEWLLVHSKSISKLSLTAAGQTL